MNEMLPDVRNLSPKKRELLERLLREKQSGPRLGNIPKRESQEPALLSFAQERLWFIDQLEPGNTAYNIPDHQRISGELDIEALVMSIREVVRRHEVLRTTFELKEREPVQVIRKETRVGLPVVDLQILTAECREAEARRVARADAERPFKLDLGPLFRVTVLKMASQDHLLVYTMHHIISDGWSMGILMREVMTFYGGWIRGIRMTLPDLPFQYADYANWQRRELKSILEEQMEYWRKQLKGARPILDLPTDHPRPAAPTYSGAAAHFCLPLELSQALSQLAEQENATLFMILLTGFNILLSRYAGIDDVVVGTPIVNRNRSELEGLIGFFVNALVLRTRVGGRQKFRQLLGVVKEVTLGAYSNQDVPFEQLVQELQPKRDPRYSPLFQVIFSFVNTPGVGSNGPDATLKGVEFERDGYSNPTAKFDLRMVMGEQGRTLTGVLEYKAELFEDETVRRMIGHYERILWNAVVADGAIKEMELMSDAEQQQVLATYRGEKAAIAVPLVPELIAEQARLRGSAEAVVSGGKRLTYQELDARAEELGAKLRELGVGPELVVGLCVERSVEMAVGILGIWKAGGAYLPLDPKYPTERLERIIRDSGVSAIVAQEHLEELLPAGALFVLTVDAGQESNWRKEAKEIVSLLRPENLAYVLYTSGSTGESKAVGVEHGQLTAYVRAVTERMGFETGERHMVVSTLNADLGNTIIYGALCQGGTLHVLEETAVLDGRRFSDYMQTEKIDCVKIVPSHLQGLSRMAKLGTILPRRKLILGGEAAKMEWTRKILDEAKECELFNHYGPTETTVGVLAWRVGGQAFGGNGNLLLGRALRGSRVYILDERFGVLPFGVRGEIYIGGSGVSRGYVNRADATAERFLPDPYGGIGQRMYRSGDWGRCLADGNVEFLGRIDLQVKIRGHRIELEEIERAAKCATEIEEAVVVVHVDKEGEQQLICYVVVTSGQEWTSIGLREQLRQKLPAAMVPGVYIRIEKMPLNANGKVNRTALLEMPVEDAGVAEPEQAQTPTEEVMTGIWCEVLKRDKVGRYEDFFGLGGHSLLATQIVSRVREIFGVDLALSTIFEAPTIANLSQHVEQSRRTESGLSAPPLVRANRAAELPLSFAQERLWFLGQLDPDGFNYNCCAAIRVRGELNVLAVDKTLNEIVSRHEVLRTTYLPVDGRPTQVIHSFTEKRLPVIDLTSLPEEARQALPRQLTIQEMRRPIDLAVGPVMRTALFHLAPQEFIILYIIHHIASDGWSQGIWNREMSILYEAFSSGRPSPLTELRLQYADYAVWQRQWLQGEVFDRLAAYWKKKLEGIPEVLNLPVDRPRSATPTQRDRTEFFSIPVELAVAIKKFTQESGATLFMGLLAGLKALLFRYSGQKEIVVGAPIASRPTPELTQTGGLFLNLVAMRTDVDGNENFRRLLADVKQTALEAYERQDFPFEKLVDILQIKRTLNWTPIYQVMFNLLNHPTEGLKTSGVRLGELEVEERPDKFDWDLRWVMSESTQGMRGALDYNAEIFDRATINRLIEDYKKLLTEAIAQPDKAINELPLLQATEAGQAGVSVLNRFPEESVQSWIEQQVLRTPQALAVVDGDGVSVSYDELNRRANRLAHYLRGQGVQAGARVAVCLERSVEMIVAVLAVVKSGAAYVPVDPEYPQERLEYMLRNAEVSLVLSHERHASRLPGIKVFCPAAQRLELMRHSSENPTICSGGGNLFYMIYTSGSTGRPKGSMVHQRGFLNLLKWFIGEFEIIGQDRVLLVSSQSFDLTQKNIFAPLLCGGLLHLLPEGLYDPLAIARMIAERRITLLNCTPSSFYPVLNELQHKVSSALRIVFLGGEDIVISKLAGWLKANPNVRICNTYGPTECTDIAAYYCMNGVYSNGFVPLGRAINRVQLYVCNPALQPNPTGVAGELCIGGDGVGQGYWNNPELTAERFIPDPFSGCAGDRIYRTGDRCRRLADGNIQFMGRMDYQIKIRGFRIEPGEIEQVIKTHSEVAEVMIVEHKPAVGEAQLVAYLVAARAGTNSREDRQTETIEQRRRQLLLEIRQRVERAVPGYMVPAKFVLLEAFPLTAHGKVDRQSLPEPGTAEPTSEMEFLAPRNEMEQRLAGIWEELLHIKKAGVHDDFFQLGGHSLLAIQLTSRIRGEFGLETPVRVLFENPTIAGLGQWLAGVMEQREKTDEGRLLKMLDQLTDEQVRAELEKRRGTEKSSTN